MNTFMGINKKELIRLSIVLIIGLIIGALVFSSSGDSDMAEYQTNGNADETIWTCSMHPQIRQHEPGLCPICAMELVPVSSTSAGDEDVDPNEIQLSASAAKLAEIQTVVVKRGIPQKTTNLLGKIKPDERNVAEITARYGGRLEKLSVNFTGQNVKKGQTLASIYSPDLITAQKELLEAIKYKDTNPSFYIAAKGKLKLWNLSDEQVAAIEREGEPQLYFDILSPISGTVTKRHVAIGEYIKKGTALFEVIDLTKVWLLFEAYESDLPWIKVSDKIEFALQSFPGKTYTGKVSYIDPFIDAATRVAQVRVEVPNPDLTLKPEMFATGTLESDFGKETNELLIPKTAILWTGKRSVVYVKIPNRSEISFLYREIVLGPEASNFYVVASGLSEGEEIAINGVFKIDASAQLAGKTSMMNPTESVSPAAHDHIKMKMDISGNKTHVSDMKNNIEQTMFRVSGNCDMCKERIVTAAMKLDGVKSTDWNEDTKMLQVSYNKDKVSLEDIHKIIALAGHDTELETAPDSVYDKLPSCCIYRR